MEQILEFARGPLFIATFTLMVLGLGRLVALGCHGVRTSPA